MAKTPFDDLLTYIRNLGGKLARADLSDSQLLDRYVAQREETAFALLVQRHGPLVLGVCQRILGDFHAAEDAFQATFLVLARRSGAIRKRALIATWLHGVAQRVALRAREQRAVARQLERRVSEMPPSDSISEKTWDELRAVLDQEIAALPQKFGAPLILCYFEDKSYDQAAQELGLSKSTLGRRVAMARELLRERLVRRGITLSAGAVATALCSKVNAAPVAALLTIHTVKAALSFTAGKAASGSISATALGLAEHVIAGTAGVRAKLTIVALLCGLMLGGVGWAAHSRLIPMVPGTEQMDPSKPNDLGAKGADRSADAEKLFKAMEQKLLAAKSLKAVYEVEIVDAGNVAGTANASQYHAEGNKLRLDVAAQFAERKDNKLIISDGRQTLISSARPGKEERQPTPGKLDSQLCVLLARAGGFMTIAAADLLLTKANEADDFAKLFQVKDFQWGDKARLGTSDVQIVEYAYTFELLGQTEKGKVKLYIDTKTQLPLKRQMTLDSKSNAVINEIFTEFELDGQLDAKLFELPLSPAKMDSTTKQPAVFAKDLYGDPLPAGAIARLGTDRFRHGQWAHAVAFSPDGKLLASGGAAQSGDLCIWDVDTGRAIHRTGAADGVMDVAFSPDGKTVCTAGLNELTLVDVASGQEIRRYRRLEGFQSSYQAAVFSPDGKLLASGEFPVLGPDGPSDEELKKRAKVVLWEVATGKVIGVFAGSQPGFSADCKMLIVSGVDPAFHFWDVASGKEVKTVEGPGGLFSSVTFSPSRKLAISGDVDLGLSGELVTKLWDLESGKFLKKLDVGKPISSRGMFSPDGRLLALGTGRTIVLLDAKTFAEIRRWPSSHPTVRSLAFSPDGKKLASTGDFEGNICLWDTATGKEIGPSASHVKDIKTIKFSPDGKTLFTLDGGPNAVEWDLKTSKERRRLPLPADAANDAVSWSPLDVSVDGRVLGLGDMRLPVPQRDPEIRLWDTGAGKEIGKLVGKTRTFAFVLSPEGKTAATTGEDGITLWQLPSGNRLNTFAGGTNVQPVFSQDGTRLAWAGPDKTIRLADTATAKEIAHWDSESEYPPHVLFSPDGKSLASASWAVQDGSPVRIWECETGREITKFGNQSAVRSMAYSVSGRLLATLGVTASEGKRTQDNTISVWEVETGQLVRSFDLGKTGGLAIGFAPSGRILAAGSGSTVLLWDLTGSAAVGQPPALTAAALDALWADLAADAAKAEPALWTLALSPQASLPLLKERLCPSESVPADQIASWIAALASTDLKSRDNATKKLEALGETAERELRKYLSTKPALEMQQRVEQILAKRKSEVIRVLRAIEGLERIGTTEAQRVLEDLAGETPNPRVANVATAALLRLKFQGGN